MTKAKLIKRGEIEAYFARQTRPRPVTAATMRTRAVLWIEQYRRNKTSAPREQFAALFSKGGNA